MNKTKEFEDRNKKYIKLMAQDKTFRNLSLKWFIKSSKYEYSYHFSWLGRPIIQFPQDVVAVQEIIWKVKPDLIIETGIAHGGSLILSASILELIGHGEVLGIDIDIRKHNRIEIEKHTMYKRITMIQGSSVDKNIVKKVNQFAKDKKRILVFLDSNHSHQHVLKEMQLYSPLVKRGCYMIVFDTADDYLPSSFFKNRPWSKGNNPKTAVLEFLKTNKRFKRDEEIENKLLISECSFGYLKCVK